MLTPACNALMQFSKDRDKPIVIIGSGKTAMDTMNALDSELGASVAGRIRCVTGHGAWFMVRDPPPNRPEEPDPFARWFGYDGTNGAAVNKLLGEQGQLHSPCKTGNFSLHFARTALKASPWHVRPGAHDVRQRDLLPRGGSGGASDPDAGGGVHPQGAPRGHRASGGQPRPSRRADTQALQLANLLFAQVPKIKKPLSAVQKQLPESDVQVCACVCAGRGGGEPCAAADRLARGPAAPTSRRAPRHLPHQLYDTFALLSRTCARALKQVGLKSAPSVRHGSVRRAAERFRADCERGREGSGAADVPARRRA